MLHVKENTQPDPKRRAFLAATATGALAVGLSAGSRSLAQSATPAVEVLGLATDDVDIALLPRVRQILVPPPFAPKHDQVATGGPKIVEVEMTIDEKLIEIDDDGASIWAFTFQGSVPGPLIVVHQGDYVELTLKNLAANELEHNIDFHAATGAPGGGEISLVLPGEQVTIRFRATQAGVFIYHCAPGQK
jgi:nitrite reductase (NO-forming)